MKVSALILPSYLLYGTNALMRHPKFTSVQVASSKDEHLQLPKHTDIKYYEPHSKREESGKLSLTKRGGSPSGEREKDRQFTWMPSEQAEAERALDDEQAIQNEENTQRAVMEAHRRRGLARVFAIHRSDEFENHYHHAWALGAVDTPEQYHWDMQHDPINLSWNSRQIIALRLAGFTVQEDEPLIAPPRYHYTEGTTSPAPSYSTGSSAPSYRTNDARNTPRPSSGSSRGNIPGGGGVIPPDRAFTYIMVDPGNSDGDGGPEVRVAIRLGSPPPFTMDGSRNRHGSGGSSSGDSSSGESSSAGGVAIPPDRHTPHRTVGSRNSNGRGGNSSEHSRGDNPGHGSSSIPRGGGVKRR